MFNLLEVKYLEYKMKFSFEMPLWAKAEKYYNCEGFSHLYFLKF